MPGLIGGGEYTECVASPDQNSRRDYGGAHRVRRFGLIITAAAIVAVPRSIHMH